QNFIAPAMIHRSWHRLAAVTLSARGLLTLSQSAKAAAGQPLPTSSKASTNASPAKAPTALLPSSVPGLNDAEARHVRREGRVVRASNIQAPGYYALEARDSGKIINFLMTSRAEPLNWRQYRGKVVIITGREYLDRRYLWNDTPLLNVEMIEAVR
ncbi:MAG: hypothetical protein NTY38_28270, partial [Acidobacteria bacterium]|nr:hypothetical protein [Acidobacteriota bacterium]